MTCNDSQKKHQPITDISNKFTFSQYRGVNWIITTETFTKELKDQHAEC